MTSVIHTNTGMRMSVMPGARMLRMVAMKFTPAMTDEAPEDLQARAARSRC